MERNGFDYSGTFRAVSYIETLQFTEDVFEFITGGNKK